MSTGSDQMEPVVLLGGCLDGNRLRPDFEVFPTAVELSDPKTKDLVRYVVTDERDRKGYRIFQHAKMPCNSDRTE